jgi:hypothetical protein
MNPVGRGTLRWAMGPVKFKYCFGDKAPRKIFCNGTVLIVVDYRAGSSETVHSGIPPLPLRKNRPALGGAAFSLGSVRVPRTEPDGKPQGWSDWQ